MTQADVVKSEDNTEIEAKTEAKIKLEYIQLRADVNKKIKEEFDMIHDAISSMAVSPFNTNEISELAKIQMELCRHLIREARALGGENPYAFGAYTPLSDD